MAANPDAIEAVRITGHARYLELCDPDHDDYRPEYLPLVREIAGKGGPDHVPVAVASGVTAATPRKPLLKITRARRYQLATCLYRENCGCVAPKCWAKGLNVVIEQCEACMPAPAKPA